MIVAEVKYTGSGRSHHRKAPSGREYMFRRYPGNPDRDELEWEPVEHREDAEWLAEFDVFEVRWKPLGRIKAASEDALEAVSDLGYNAKQRLVGEDGFDLEVAGNADEETLEEALADHVKELQEEGEL